MRFEEAFDKTVWGWEGGDKLHTVPGDPGGTTRWGIAQRFHPEVDVRTMTEDEAKSFYYRKFWAAVRAPLLPPELRWDVFDYGVNRHPVTSIRTLQRAVNACNLARHRPLIAEDGRFGPRTRESLSALPPERVLLVFRGLRTQYYVERSSDPQQIQFLEGWLDRVNGDRGRA